MIIRTSIVGLFRARAVTVWPFVFVAPDNDTASVLLHERVHLAQQRRWARFAGVGLLAWFALYLLALPVGWNPWRRRWETEAHLAQGIPEAEIREILRRAPYYLWFLKKGKVTP